MALVSERPPRAAQPALNFIGNQGGAVAGRKLPSARPERAAQRKNTTFALYGLEHDGANRIDRTSLRDPLHR